jgi:RHS repeat-associated protein
MRPRHPPFIGDPVFTGKPRDYESGLGLDYFGARYVSGPQGRWTSPDLVNVTNARLLEPSNTLNKYVYNRAA